MSLDGKLKWMRKSSSRLALNYRLRLVPWVLPSSSYSDLVSMCIYLHHEYILVRSIYLALPSGEKDIQTVHSLQLLEIVVLFWVIGLM
jgi:hypothetical protein